MDIYYLQFNAVPTQGAEQYGQIGGAIIEAWVCAQDEHAAHTQAQSKIMDYAWNVLALEDARLLQFERPEDLDIEFQAHVQAAQQMGVHLVFLAYPIEDRDDNSVEIHKLGNPPDHSGSLN